MLLQTISSKLWQDNFIKKFSSFAKKSPVLISMFIKTYEGEEGVQVTHQNSGQRYFYPFDYNIDVKDFISQIKEDLVAYHYPRIIEEVLETHELSPIEMAIELEKGKTPGQIQKTVLRSTGQRIFTISKVLLWKSIFILQLEKSTFEEDEIGAQYRYKYNGSGVAFLKKYRSNGFGSLEEASEFFFKNTNLIDKITTVTN